MYIHNYRTAKNAITLVADIYNYNILIAYYISPDITFLE